MQRKLATPHRLTRSFRALGLVLSLATAVLIGAAPAPGTPDAVFSRGAVVVPATAEPQAPTGSAKAYSRQRRAEAREAMALPFFSFAQGLRGGNRS